MSSLDFLSSFPRSQNGQNDSFWNPISPPAPSKTRLPQAPYQISLTHNPLATHHRRQSDYLSRTMSNALGIVPLPNFNFDERKPHRITSPLSNVKPIGYERTISRQMGYSHFSISEVGEDVPMVEQEESGGNSPIITQSLIQGIHPVRHGASNSMQEDGISILDLETSMARLNVNEQSPPSKGKKSYGTLQRNLPYAHARDHTANTSMHPSSVATRNRDITAIFQGPQFPNSLSSSSGAPYAPSTQFQPLGHRAAGYQQNRSMTSYEGPGQYMSQFNSQVVGNPPTIDDDNTGNRQMPMNSFVHTQSNEVSRSLRTPVGNSHPGAYFAQFTSNAPSASVSSMVGQISNNTSGISSVQSGMRQTNKVLREHSLLAPLPSSTAAVSHNLNDKEDRELTSKFGGEAHLPNELNCAVWIQGIPKDFTQQFLYQELFNVVSAGPIIAVYINFGGDQHPHHAAKVIFKHPEHAARLFQRAFFQGIYINGNRIRVEPNRHGHRGYPLKLHYRSRVVLVEVFNNPSMDLAFWQKFIANLCVYDIERCRHLAYSSPKRMVMEFRFARIFGQASILLAGIMNTAAFEGIVTARYIPDVPCDICDVY
ncbi:uncharacterized protein EAF01_011362 [Botrytis porri]|uniref:RRM domain-containing protein n=1 Tax=Botrytis porri TaxID=87229 RepID=A0A4Z1K9J0_9HELO|nr:uncharacterized protein EAF01_011362 [Botrytis porri]KAF7885297.1 hypothetical protein EAF01_011362 [Botrytis porri]TGO82086.1 hypothetical protein BPOR_0925g00020 [Botrytis porri]